jgi:hypothetical protein
MSDYNDYRPAALLDPYRAYLNTWFSRHFPSAARTEKSKSSSVLRRVAVPIGPFTAAIRFVLRGESRAVAVCGGQLLPSPLPRPTPHRPPPTVNRQPSPSVGSFLPGGEKRGKAQEMTWPSQMTAPRPAVPGDSRLIRNIADRENERVRRSFRDSGRRCRRKNEAR